MGIRDRVKRVGLDVGASLLAMSEVASKFAPTTQAEVHRTVKLHAAAGPRATMRAEYRPGGSDAVGKVAL